MADLEIARYPHITSLFLNAAVATGTHIDFIKFFKHVFTDGLVETITDPKFMPDAAGVMTADGERGLIWSVNVLASYIMVRLPKLAYLWPSAES